MRKLAPVKATAGEAAAFEIELSKGDASARWRRDGAEIGVDQDRVRLRIDGKVQRLEIADVRTSDAGEYSCAIDGADAACSARLEVEEPKVWEAGESTVGLLNSFSFLRSGHLRRKARRHRRRRLQEGCQNRG